MTEVSANLDPRVRESLLVVLERGSTRVCVCALCRGDQFVKGLGDMKIQPKPCHGSSCVLEHGGWQQSACSLDMGGVAFDKGYLSTFPGDVYPLFSMHGFSDLIV